MSPAAPAAGCANTSRARRSSPATTTMRPAEATKRPERVDGGSTTGANGHRQTGPRQDLCQAHSLVGGHVIVGGLLLLSLGAQLARGGLGELGLETTGLERASSRQLYAERRNFGQRVQAASNSSSPDSLLGRTINRWTNQTQPPPIAAASEPFNRSTSGKLEMLTKLFSRYRLPRAKATSAEMQAASNGTTLGAEESAPYHLHMQHQLAAPASNATKRDYQLVKLNGSPAAGDSRRGSKAAASSGLEEVMRAKQEDGEEEAETGAGAGRDASEGDRAARERHSGHWARHKAAESGSEAEGGGGGGAADGWNLEEGHRKHGWKNVYHRDEQADNRKYHDFVAASKPAGQATEENFRFQRGNQQRAAANASDDGGKPSDVGRYEFVKGSEWRRSEEADSSDGGKLRGSYGNSGSPSSDDYAQAAAPQASEGPDESDNSAVDQIKEKLERLSGEQAQSGGGSTGAPGEPPLEGGRRESGEPGEAASSQHYSSGSEAAQGGPSNGGGGDEDEDEEPVADRRLAPNSTASWRHHNIQDILKTTRGSHRLKAAQQQQQRHRAHLAPAKLNASSYSSEAYDGEAEGESGDEEADGPSLAAPIPVSQERKPAKKDEKIRLKLELDLGKSTGDNNGAQQTALAPHNLAKESKVRPRNHTLHHHQATTRYTAPRRPGGGGRAGPHHLHHLQQAPSHLQHQRGLHQGRHTNESRWARPGFGPPLLQHQTPAPSSQLWAPPPPPPPGEPQRPLAASKFGLLDGQLMGFREPASSRRPNNGSRFLAGSGGWAPSYAAQHPNYTSQAGDYGVAQGSGQLLQQVLPNRPIFVKHLQMNGRVVLSRPVGVPGQNMSLLQPTMVQLPVGVGEDMAVETTLSNAFGDIVAIPGAQLVEEASQAAPGEVAPPLPGPETPADGRDYLMTYAGEAPPHSHHPAPPQPAEPAGYFEAAEGAPLVSSLVEPAESFANQHQHQVNELESLLGEEHRPQLVEAGQPSGFSLLGLAHHAHPHHAHRLVHEASQLVPQALRHPMVAHPHQLAALAASHLKQAAALNYATLLVGPGGLGVGGIVIPAMQHTFERLLRLPRVLGPAFADKQQLVSAASQLNMNIQRHLLGPPGGKLGAFEAGKWRPFRRPLLAAGYTTLHQLPGGQQQPQELDLVGAATRIVAAGALPAGAALVLPARLAAGSRARTGAKAPQEPAASSGGEPSNQSGTSSTARPAHHSERTSPGGNRSTSTRSPRQRSHQERRHLLSSTSTRQPATSGGGEQASSSSSRAPQLAWFSLHPIRANASSEAARNQALASYYQAQDLLAAAAAAAAGTTSKPFFGQRILTSFKNRLNG